jgi:hypothetical protein
VFRHGKSLEWREGISYRVDGSRIVFTAGETATAFELLETAQILTNRTEEAEIIVTFATNGGLQIKARTKGNRNIEAPLK